MLLAYAYEVRFNGICVDNKLGGYIIYDQSNVIHYKNNVNILRIPHILYSRTGTV